MEVKIGRSTLILTALGLAPPTQALVPRLPCSYKWPWIIVAHGLCVEVPIHESPSQWIMSHVLSYKKSCWEPQLLPTSAQNTALYLELKQLSCYKDNSHMHKRQGGKVGRPWVPGGTAEPGVGSGPS